MLGIILLILFLGVVVLPIVISYRMYKGLQLKEGGEVAWIVFSLPVLFWLAISFSLLHTSDTQVKGTFKFVAGTEWPVSARIVEKNSNIPVPMMMADEWCESLIEVSEEDYKNLLDKFNRDSFAYSVNPVSKETGKNRFSYLKAETIEEAFTGRGKIVTLLFQKTKDILKQISGVVFR